jgi:hypothetical protein
VASVDVVVTTTVGQDEVPQWRLQLRTKALESHRGMWLALALFGIAVAVAFLLPT